MLEVALGLALLLFHFIKDERRSVINTLSFFSFAWPVCLSAACFMPSSYLRRPNCFTRRLSLVRALP